MFSSDEIERYARHLVLRDVGGPGQQKLKAATVTVVGAGGLGSPVLLYLAAAGVGKLRIIDDDVVSLSNLQRQVLHGTTQVDMPKTESAAQTLSALNPHVQIDSRCERLLPETADKLLAGSSVVVDGSDSFETRDLVARTCEALATPLVTGAVGLFDGSLTVLMPFKTNQAGKQNPRYQDLFPEPPPSGAIPSCEEAGVLGALTGVIGTLQAMETIKLIVGIGEPLVGRLLMYDARAASFDTIRYARV